MFIKEMLTLLTVSNGRKYSQNSHFMCIHFLSCVPFLLFYLSECVKLIKNNSRDIYNDTKDFYLK